MLQKNKQRILKGLLWFEAPNAKSAAIIKSGQATWRDKTLPIDKTQQEFVLQLSEAMVCLPPPKMAFTRSKAAFRCYLIIETMSLKEDPCF